MVTRPLTGAAISQPSHSNRRKTAAGRRNIWDVIRKIKAAGGNVCMVDPSLHAGWKEGIEGPVTSSGERANIIPSVESGLAETQIWDETFDYGSTPELQAVWDSQYSTGADIQAFVMNSGNARAANGSVSGVWARGIRDITSDVTKGKLYRLDVTCSPSSGNAGFAVRIGDRTNGAGTNWYYEELGMDDTVTSYSIFFVPQFNPTTYTSVYLSLYSSNTLVDYVDYLQVTLTEIECYPFSQPASSAGTGLDWHPASGARSPYFHMEGGIVYTEGLWSATSPSHIAMIAAHSPEASLVEGRITMSMDCPSTVDYLAMSYHHSDKAWTPGARLENNDVLDVHPGECHGYVDPSEVIVQTVVNCLSGTAEDEDIEIRQNGWVTSHMIGSEFIENGLTTLSLCGSFSNRTAIVKAEDVHFYGGIWVSDYEMTEEDIAICEQYFARRGNVQLKDDFHPNNELFKTGADGILVNLSDPRSVIWTDFNDSDGGAATHDDTVAMVVADIAGNFAETEILSDDFSSYADTAALEAVWQGWHGNGAGATIEYDDAVTLDNGKLKIDNNGGDYSRAVYTLAGLTVGKTYRIDIDVHAVQNTTAQFRMQSQNANGDNGSPNIQFSGGVGAGTHTIYTPGNATTMYLTFMVKDATVDASYAIWINSITVTEIDAIMFYQLTAANRPTLKVAGPRKWLSLDGTTDTLVSRDVTLPSYSTWGAGYMPDTVNDDNTMFMEHGPDGTSNDGWTFDLEAATRSTDVRRTTNHYSQGEGGNEPYCTKNKPAWHSASYNPGFLPSVDFGLAMDGKIREIAAVTGTDVGDSNVTDQLFIGSRNQASKFVKGSIFGWYMTRAPITENRFNLDMWLRKHTIEVPDGWVPTDATSGMEWFLDIQDQSTMFAGGLNDDVPITADTTLGRIRNKGDLGGYAYQASGGAKGTFKQNVSRFGKTINLIDNSVGDYMIMGTGAGVDDWLPNALPCVISCLVRMSTSSASNSVTGSQTDTSNNRCLFYFTNGGDIRYAMGDMASYKQYTADIRYGPEPITFIWDGARATIYRRGKAFYDVAHAVTGGATTNVQHFLGHNNGNPVSQLDGNMYQFCMQTGTLPEPIEMYWLHEYMMKVADLWLGRQKNE
jgi:hypothetical protein